MGGVMTTATLPARGTVWRHAKRTDAKGEPLVLTVTSITKGKVYSRHDEWPYKLKTSVQLFDQMCQDIVSLPGPKVRKSAPKFAKADAKALYARAHEAGDAAAQACVPVPMYVVQHAHPLDDSSPIVKRYAPIMDGICGFAWINVTPGTSSFARFLKEEDLCSPSHYGGVMIWVGDYNQSYEKKSAYAAAFARVLREAGVEARSMSRLD